jgi:hypothetical protein
MAIRLYCSDAYSNNIRLSLVKGMGLIIPELGILRKRVTENREPIGVGRRKAVKRIYS